MTPQEAAEHLITAGKFDGYTIEEAASTKGGMEWMREQVHLSYLDKETRSAIVVYLQSLVAAP